MDELFRRTKTKINDGDYSVQEITKKRYLNSEGSFNNKMSILKNKYTLAKKPL